MKFLYHKDGHYRAINENNTARAWQEAEEAFGPGGQLFQEVERPSHDLGTRLVDGELVHDRYGNGPRIQGYRIS